MLGSASDPASGPGRVTAHCSQLKMQLHSSSRLFFSDYAILRIVTGLETSLRYTETRFVRQMPAHETERTRVFERERATSPRLDE
jgi:hypothetical protein